MALHAENRPQLACSVGQVRQMHLAQPRPPGRHPGRVYCNDRRVIVCRNAHGARSREEGETLPIEGRVKERLSDAQGVRGSLMEGPVSPEDPAVLLSDLWSQFFSLKLTPEGGRGICFPPATNLLHLNQRIGAGPSLRIQHPIAHLSPGQRAAANARSVYRAPQLSICATRPGISSAGMTPRRCLSAQCGRPWPCGRCRPRRGAALVPSTQTDILQPPALCGRRSLSLAEYPTKPHFALLERHVVRAGHSWSSPPMPGSPPRARRAFSPAILGPI